MKKINDTTLTADNLGDVKPKILIGGKDSSKFVPNINASFFDDEFYFNLNRKEKIVKNDTSLSVTSDKAELGGDDTDIFYEKDGRLKWDIRFSSQPANLKLTWEIKCSKGLEFYYQDELSEEEKKEECFRPDDIIGSYAVYCNKKHNKYKTGKLFHIPRPFVIDSNGSTEWCILNIDKNELSITLPEIFMQNAVYPIVLDPTFGYTAAGASEDLKNSADLPIGLLYGTHTAGSGESITQYSFYGRAYSSNATVEIAAYSVSGGDFVSRLAAAVSISVTGTEYQWWNSSTISQSLESGTTYGLGWYTSSSAYVYTKFDAEYDSPSSYHSTAESLPATWSESSTVNRKYSMYATYSAGGGTAGNPYYYYRNQ